MEKERNNILRKRPNWPRRKIHISRSIFSLLFNRRPVSFVLNIFLGLFERFSRKVCSKSWKCDLIRILAPSDFQTLRSGWRFKNVFNQSYPANPSSLLNLWFILEFSAELNAIGLTHSRVSVEPYFSNLNYFLIFLI